MLTKDLLRFKVEKSAVKPTFLKATPAVKKFTEQLLQLWKGLIGERKVFCEEQSQRLCYQARSLHMARGLQKLILDGCTFSDPTDVREWRWQALEASAAALLSGAQETADAHLEFLADELDVEPLQLEERLYADLPEEARLESAPDWSAERLIERYNRSLVQGLLLSADELEITLASDDVGTCRRILNQVRFHRLLGSVRHGSDGLVQLTLSGPAAILEQSQRYGLQLAQCFPVIACAKKWSLRTTVKPEKRGSKLTFELDQTCPVVGSSRFLGYVPEEFSQLQEHIESKQRGWRCSVETEWMTVPGSGEVIVPDFSVKTAVEESWVVELFHRWHWRRLKTRLDYIQTHALDHLILGVDRAILKRADCKELEDHPVFHRHVFLFSSYPTQRSLVTLINQRTN